MTPLQDQFRTEAVSCCGSCGSGLLERDKFCRWCGASQPGFRESMQTRSMFLEAPSDARRDVYHRVSGPLVTAVVSGALTGQPAEDVSPMIKRAILALIWIPIWLIIVLLSPLDAYSAVRLLARQT